MVDSLDSLWIMGMEKEFEEALEQVARINFKTSNRKDIPVFETVIRYLGGLISAFDLTPGKYSILLDKAMELAEILMGAFDTPNRMPITYYPLGARFSFTATEGWKSYSAGRNAQTFLFFVQRSERHQS